MKTFFYTIFSFLFAHTAISQVTKGTKLITGNLSSAFTLQSYSGFGSSSYPQIAVASNYTGFYKDDKAFEVILSCSYRKLDVKNEDYVSDVVNIGPGFMWKRYWGKGDFRFWGSGGFSLNFSQYKAAFTNNPIGTGVSNGYHSFEVKPLFGLGVNYLLNKHWWIEAFYQNSTLPLSFGVAELRLVKVIKSSINPNEVSSGIQQFQKGNTIIGGSFRLSNRQSTKNENYNSSGKSVGIVFGKMMSNRWLLNTAIEYFKTSSTTIDRGTVYKSEQDAFSFAIAPKHYLFDKKLTPFIAPTLTYLSYKSSPAGSISPNNNHFIAGLEAGLAYCAGERFIIEGSMAVANLQLKGDMLFSLLGTTSPSVRFYYLIPKK